MNSVILQGVSPVMPVTVIVLFLLFAAMVSWWSYQHLTAIRPWKKWSLISLRALSLAILVLLLLNPFRSVENTEAEAPKIAVYLDDSQSIAVIRGEYNGLDSFQMIFENLKNSLPGQFEYDYYLFSDEVRSGDEAEAYGTSTHLNNVLDHINQYENEYQASILISDGIFTQGRNPAFTAQRLTTPLITIPAGDTTTVKDILVANVDYNQLAYTNTLHRFTADVQQMEFEGEEITVQFVVDGEVQSSQPVSFNAPSSSHLVEFTHEFTESGFYDVEVNIPARPEEYTDKNNSSSFTLEAIDDKTRILSLAFEVHPDVAAIRRVVATDQQNELFSSTYIGNGRFLGEDPRAAGEDYDLLILHGLPESGSEIHEWITARRLPVIYIATPTASERLVTGDFEDFVSLQAEETGAVLDVHIQQPNQDRVSHPLLEMDHPVMNRFPALKAYEGRYSASPLSEILLRAEYQRNPTDIPLLVSEDTHARRLVTVNAFGWYRLSQNRNEDASKFFEQLITNITGWSSTPPEQRNLFLEPVKPTFSENEPIQLRAILTNERGDRESDAQIELNFYEDETDESRVFRMNPAGNGSYRADVGTYPQGIYRVEGIATKNEREIGRAETRVRVNQSFAELINTKRNDELLDGLAAATGGLFLHDYQYDRINQFLDEQNLDEIQREVSTEFIYTFETGWWFFLVIILLSGEWILRRTISLP